MVTNESVLKALSAIIDPDLNRDIVSLGFIKELVINNGVVSFSIELTTPACPLKNKFKKDAEDAVKAISGVTDVKVNMTARGVTPANTESGLGKVKSIIAVASCKGGVGKSTTAATIASELAGRGFKVGLLDVDLFGPSIPTLFNVHNPSIKQIGNMIFPVEVNNLKVMSFGFLLGDSPAIMRGPMVSGYIQQLLHSVEWGELDYLFIDMPPGTGDIQLTISQSVRLSGAVVVTTRASLSLVDVVKGILMFEKVGIPMLGVIENMAYFTCDSCDKKHFIFGEEKTLLSDRFGLDSLAVLPLDPEKGKPFDKFESDELSKELVDNLVRAIGKHEAEKVELPKVNFDAEKVEINWIDGTSVTISNKKLRDNCQCALCVDEYTGVKTLKYEDIADDIQVLEVVPLGNYAINVKWSDGHTSSIYPYKQLKALG
jgi:Mrp family chromosome partitioning ATPase/DUF971 family protein